MADDKNKVFEKIKEMVDEGLTNAQIATKLDKTTGTIVTYKCEMKKKGMLPGRRTKPFPSKDYAELQKAETLNLVPPINKVVSDGAKSVSDGAKEATNYTPICREYLVVIDGLMNILMDFYGEDKVAICQIMNIANAILEKGISDEIKGANNETV